MRSGQQEPLILTAPLFMQLLVELPGGLHTLGDVEDMQHMMSLRIRVPLLQSIVVTEAVFYVVTV